MHIPEWSYCNINPSRCYPIVDKTPVMPYNHCRCLEKYRSHRDWHYLFLLCNQCISCETKFGNTPEVGWYTELQSERNSIHPVDLKRLPPIHNAISEQQLQWLYCQLQEATRNADNVIVACKFIWIFNERNLIYPTVARNQFFVVCTW